jgi:hypothetical protein
VKSDLAANELRRVALVGSGDDDRLVFRAAERLDRNVWAVTAGSERDRRAGLGP